MPGHARQRKDGRWEIVAYQNGRRHSFYGATRSAAVSAYQASFTVPVALAQATLFHEYLYQWVRDVLPLEVSERTVENYVSVIAKHIEPALGAFQLQDIRPRHVDAMLRQVAPLYSRSTVRLVKTVTHRVLRHAVFEELIPVNPADSVRMPQRVRGAAASGRALTPMQCAALIKAFDQDRLGNLFKVMLGLGLRPGEVAGLCWDVVNFDTGVIEVRRFVRLEGGVLKLVNDVKNHKPRTVQASTFVLDALRAQLGARIHPSGLVFGSLLHPNTVRQRFKACCQTADLGVWHPNELRHTFVSMMSAQGKTPEEIADYVGHSPAIDKGVYRHALTNVIDLGAPVEVFGA